MMKFATIRYLLRDAAGPQGKPEPHQVSASKHGRHMSSGLGSCSKEANHCLTCDTQYFTHQSLSREKGESFSEGHGSGSAAYPFPTRNPCRKPGVDGLIGFVHTSCLGGLLSHFERKPLRMGNWRSRHIDRRPDTRTPPWPLVAQMTVARPRESITRRSLF